MPFVSYSIMIAMVILTACNKPDEESSPPLIEELISTDIPPVETELIAEIQASATPNILDVEAPDPDRVAYDFVSEVCSADWTTNAAHLPCPMNIDEAEGAYVEATDHTVLEGMVSVDAPLLIGLSGSGYPTGVGLFGKFPPFTVYPGDTFHSSIACQGDSDCDLKFSLEYIPEGSNRDTGWRWEHKAGDGPQQVSADLSSLAGQTVELYLVLRPQDDYENQWAVWIQPYIDRDPDAEPLPTVEVLPTPTPDPGDQTPGVISGMVDMSSAPPYLKDSMSGGSSPVAVVFYNLSDGTYWWIHTSLTGHPYFQMTITPGDYQVVAYAPGVGDMPYVAGGYTGQNPSCGKNLKTITMTPNGRLENIVVADWNWVCGGTASRQPKPGGVPLP